MLGFGSATRVYVAIGATDMRKGFEGLFGIVRDRLVVVDTVVSKYLDHLPLYRQSAILE
jgi:transposase